MLKKILAIVAMLYAAVAFAAVDVNKATAAELDAIKGIGPGISTKILDERKKGNFKDWNDFIERVKGVGEGNAAKFSAEGMTVGGAAFKAASTAPAAAAKPAAPASAAKPAAAAPAKEEKKDPKAEAKMKADEAKAKKEADKKAKDEAKKKAADEAKMKKEADMKAKDDAKKAAAAKTEAPKAAASAPKAAASAAKK